MAYSNPNMTDRKIPVILLAVMVLFSACAQKPQKTQETFYVSILPLRGLVHEIVGNDLPIEVLVPAGASPETFEPTPQQFVALNQARLIFNVGLLDFENGLIGKIANQQKVIDLHKGIKLLTETCSHTEYCKSNGCDTNHHAHGIDPHIWTSPKALQCMAKNAYDAIRRIYPDSTKYEANYRKLHAKLVDLDNRTARRIEESGIRMFVIYHPALTYFARDYGLQQIAIEDEGKEPSARHLARLIEQARAQKIRNIFYQSQFPASTVEIIAHDIGATAVRIDPLREDAIANIEEITCLITAR